TFACDVNEHLLRGRPRCLGVSTHTHDIIARSSVSSPPCSATYHCVGCVCWLSPTFSVVIETSYA
ncbi:hypothetical protein TRIATDRAFT_299516, partial [Trichoderma atroviride IMI 206040]